MHKWIMAALLIVASIMGIGYTIEAMIEADRAHVADEVPDNGLRINAYNWYFDEEEYTVEAGEPVVISMRNMFGRHNIKIEELDLIINEGDEVEHTFEPGVYTILCDIMCGEGHYDMVAKLVVQ